MQVLPVRGGALVCCFLYLFVVGFSNADGKTVEVVGVGECADCAENNFETSKAFSGLRVNIDCKPKNGEYFNKRGSGELDKEGNFKVSLPEEMVKDGELMEECYAQLHSVLDEPCPAHDGIESVKIVLKSTSDEKHNFGLKGKLRFSPVTCASATFWHHPPLPKWNHPPLPTFPLPPSNGFHFHHHHPIFPPIYMKPLPPSVPVSKPPPVPVYENHFLHQFQYTRSHFFLQFQYIRNHIPLQFQSISLHQFRYIRNHFLLQFLYTGNHYLHQFQCTNNLRLQSIQSRYHHLFLYTGQNRSLHFPKSHHSLRSHALPFPRFLQSISTTILSSENGLHCHHFLLIIPKLL
ncbi:proline-rich protein 4-like isoform X3 [Hibiscus syriacus]|uniref:proline-rich protein 4-like isoform X3 n=1 Tax=Hibiscus syriacus TaxID=106335 RepID=UPI001922615E|nr:proline-rich protein 4-like isoform X3 [Hibiscus syriacus]